VFMVSGWPKRSLLGDFVLEHCNAGDDSPVHFFEDHQPAEIESCPAFVPRNNPGMGLEQADELLLGWHLLPVMSQKQRVLKTPRAGSPYVNLIFAKSCSMGAKRCWTSRYTSSSCE